MKKGLEHILSPPVNDADLSNPISIQKVNIPNENAKSNQSSANNLTQSKGLNISELQKTQNKTEKSRPLKIEVEALANLNSDHLQTDASNSKINFKNTEAEIKIDELKKTDETLKAKEMNEAIKARKEYQNKVQIMLNRLNRLKRVEQEAVKKLNKLKNKIIVEEKIVEILNLIRRQC